MSPFTTISSQFMAEPAWAEEMRSHADPEERMMYPAFIPWVHEGGREELRQCGLPFLTQLEEGGAMATGMKELMEEHEAMVEECQDAMSVTAAQVLKERRQSLAELIREAVACASEEDQDQVEVLKNLEEALGQDTSGRGRQAGIIAEEAATIHYLYHTLTMMKCFRYVRDRCIQQAQVVDMVLSTIWQKGVPSQVVQQLKAQETSSVKRTKEVIRYRTKRTQGRAYGVL